MYPPCQLIIYEPIKKPRTVNINFNPDFINANYLVFNEDGSIADQYDTVPEFVDDTDADTESEVKCFKNVEIQNFLLAYQPISVKKQKKIDRFKKSRQELRIKKQKNQQRKRKKKFSDLMQHFSEDAINLSNRFDFNSSCSQPKDLVQYDNFPMVNGSGNSQISTVTTTRSNISNFISSSAATFKPSCSEDVVQNNFDYISLSNGCNRERMPNSCETFNMEHVAQRSIQWKCKSSNAIKEESNFISDFKNSDVNRNLARPFFSKKFYVNNENDQRKPTIGIRGKKKKKLKNTFFKGKSNFKRDNFNIPALENKNSTTMKQNLDYIPINTKKTNSLILFRGPQFKGEKFNTYPTGRYFNLPQ